MEFYNACMGWRSTNGRSNCTRSFGWLWSHECPLLSCYSFFLSKCDLFDLIVTSSVKLLFYPWNSQANYAYPIFLFVFLRESLRGNGSCRDRWLVFCVFGFVIVSVSKLFTGIYLVMNLMTILYQERIDATFGHVSNINTLFGV